MPSSEAVPERTRCRRGISRVVVIVVIKIEPTYRNHSVEDKKSLESSYAKYPHSRMSKHCGVTGDLFCGGWCEGLLSTANRMLPEQRITSYANPEGLYG